MYVTDCRFAEWYLIIGTHEPQTLKHKQTERSFTCRFLHICGSKTKPEQT
jgi:hypothetical protein